MRQTTHDFALTVADDGSSDGTGALVETFAKEAQERGIPLNHVWQEDRGFRRAAVLNEGVRHSQGEPLLIFTDADCVPPASFVERHLAAHTPRSFHVAGAWRLPQQVSGPLTEEDIDSGAYEALASAAPRAPLAKRRRKSRWGTLLHRKNRPKILGLNIGMDRSLFVELNGFDERFTAWGLEDSDLRDRAMRLRPRPRVRNLYLENDVFHLWHPTHSGQTRRTQWDYYSTDRPVSCEIGLARREADPPLPTY